MVIKTLFNGLSRQVIAVLAGLLLWFAASLVYSADVGSASAAPKCLMCHQFPAKFTSKQSTQLPHSDISVHGGASGAEACLVCHGESLAHSKSFGKKAPQRSFSTPSEDASKTCFTCHKSALLMHWEAGSHREEGLQCVQCHKIHIDKDPIMQRSQEVGMCTSCHNEQKAESLMPSSHPIDVGQSVCTDCHNPHGNLNPNQLLQVSVNENCFSCHADKRGPFLFEHAPVSDDCSTCHKPHGSVHNNLLTSRSPFLCQQCHMGAFHTSELQSGAGLGGSASLSGKDCMNCHSQIHGSNHPSGSFLSR